MRIFVGRRIQAKAASSSDRRNLYEHEPKVGGGSGVTAYCKIESRSPWAAIDGLPSL